jgi:hypothetical protein
MVAMANNKAEIWGGGPLESEAARSILAFIENETYKRVHQSSVNSLEAGSWNPATEGYLLALWAMLPTFSGYIIHFYRGISLEHRNVWSSALKLDNDHRLNYDEILKAFRDFDFDSGLPRLRRMPSIIPHTKQEALQDVFNVAWEKLLNWSSGSDPEPGFMGPLWAITLITKKVPEFVSVWPSDFLELSAVAFDRYINNGAKKIKPAFKEGLIHTFQTMLADLNKMKAEFDAGTQPQDV